MIRTLLVSLALLTVTLDVRAEFAVPATEPTPRFGERSTPVIASVPEGFAVVWRETRWGSLGGSVVDSNGRFVRALIGEDGAPTGWTMTPARAVAGGGSVLVIGPCSREPTGPPSLGAVCLARVSPEGQIEPARIIEEGGNDPDIAWNGREFLVMWRGRVGGSSQIRGVVIGADGAVGEPFELGPSQAGYGPSVAASGGRFFVAWRHWAQGYVLSELVGGAHAQTVSLEVRTEGDTTVWPLVIRESNGEILAIARATTPAEGGPRRELRVRRYRELEPLGPWNVAATPAESDFAHAFLAPAGWTLVTADPSWIEPRPVHATVIDASGQRIAGRVLVSDVGRAPPTYFPATAADGETVAVAWTRVAPPGPLGVTTYDVLMQVADAGPAQIVSLGAGTQLVPVAAFGAGAWLVAWNERTREGDWRVRVARVDAGGALLGDPVEIPSTGADQLRPAVAFNGESFLLVWSEGSGGLVRVAGIRVAADGTLIDSAPIAIFGNGAPSVPYRPRTADVAWEGRFWIVASSDAAGQVVLRRVAATGHVLDPEPVVIPRLSHDDRNPLLSCSANECLVVWLPPIPWSCPILCIAIPDSVGAIRVDSNLRLLDEAPVRVNSVTDGPTRGVRALSAAWNAAADAWLVAWTRRFVRVPRSGPLPANAEGTLLVGSGRTVSTVAEGDGWRIGWDGALAGRVGAFTAWTTGMEGEPALIDPSVLLATPGDEIDVLLASGPRTLALVTIRDRPHAGAVTVVGTFADEADSVGRRRPVRR